MSSYTGDRSSPFTRAVVNSMRKLYPESLADKSFDNTGLLLEAPFDPLRRQANSVLLTVDLTKAVADEAIARQDCIVVAYHPIIFRGLKSLTLADTQQQSLLRLALEGISVYSPHTAVDAVPSGLGDWLADIVTGTLSDPEPSTHTAADGEMPRPDTGPTTVSASGKETAASKDDSSPSTSKRDSEPIKAGRIPIQQAYSKPTYPASQPVEKTVLEPSSVTHTRTTIHPSPSPPPGHESAGMGRLITFSTPQPLTHLIERIARGVGTPAGFPVAIPQYKNIEDIQIRTVAVCAGSGGHTLSSGVGVASDLWFTGELSHHEALAVTERGGCVVTLFHSNSERGFLRSVMKPKLERELREEWARVRKEDTEEEGWKEALGDEDVEVEVSERDRDPYGIVLLQGSQVEGTVVGIEKPEQGPGNGRRREAGRRD